MDSKFRLIRQLQRASGECHSLPPYSPYPQELPANTQLRCTKWMLLLRRQLMPQRYTHLELPLPLCTSEWGP